MIRRLRSDDSGFTLIELMAVVLLLSMVMSVLGGIFISTITTQQVVQNRTEASNSAQLVASAIDSGVRNASEFELSAAGADQLLVMRTATTGSNIGWTCNAWYFANAAGEVRTTTGPVGTFIDAPSSSELAAWTLVASGVSPVAGTTIFSTSGGKLTVAFDVLLAADDEPRPIQFTTAKLTSLTETHA